MSNFQNQCISAYEKNSKVPILDSVSVNTLKDDSNNIYYWQAKWSQRDIGRNTKVNICSSGTVKYQDQHVVSSLSPFTAEITNEKLMSVSPSQEMTAKLLEIEIKGEKHFFLEIWKGTYKAKSIDLTEEKKHGIVHTNSTFGCLHWSHDNSKLVYIAEKKLPIVKSYFDKTEEDATKGKEFVYKEDWGEQLVGSFHPTLFMFDLKLEKITDLSECFPDNPSISTALWSQDDKCLYVLCWNSKPWKLGLVYCKNRFSTLYKLNLESRNVTRLTDDKSCVFAPVLSPDGTILLYLQTLPLGPHGQCSKMMSLDLSQSLPAKTLIDVVDHEADSNKFQGLFVDSIVKNCWLADKKRLIVNSMHRSNIGLLCIDIEKGKVNVLENEGTWKILNVTDNILFASFSTPNMPTIFKAGTFHLTNIHWVTVEAPVPKIENITWSVQKHDPPVENKQYPGLDYESIFVRPTGDAPVKGLIVNPHGGPHSAFSAGFDVFTASFVQLGYAVIRVNYRGSLGFGQNNVMSLPNRIGYQDVMDVQIAAQAAAHDLHISPAKTFVTGGSHGGFLTLHLVGQHPDFYAAGATRNPVTNLASQAGTSDIMDWCYLEGGAKFSYDCIPTAEDMKKMLECSPIVHAAKVKAPLLIMVGSVDLRVPPSQSYQYAHCLKGLGKTVTILKYDDNSHPIAKVNAEADCFVNSVMWFENQSL